MHFILGRLLQKIGHLYGCWPSRVGPRIELREKIASEWEFWKCIDCVSFSVAETEEFDSCQSS